MDLDGAKNSLKLQGFLVFVTNSYEMGKKRTCTLLFMNQSLTGQQWGKLHVDSLIGWPCRAGFTQLSSFLDGSYYE